MVSLSRSLHRRSRKGLRVIFFTTTAPAWPQSTQRIARTIPNPGRSVRYVVQPAACSLLNLALKLTSSLSPFGQLDTSTADGWQTGSITHSLDFVTASSWVDSDLSWCASEQSLSCAGGWPCSSCCGGRAISPSSLSPPAIS